MPMYAVVCVCVIMDPCKIYRALCHAGTAQPAGPKKKRIIKLSRKQKLRKVARVARGEARADRREKKSLKDARKLDQKLAAKALW